MSLGHLELRRKKMTMRAMDFQMTNLRPAATRVILEAEMLLATLGENCRCSECKSPVLVELKTICLATSIELTCTNAKCGYIYYSHPPAQVKAENEDRRERSTDYAVNVLYVLGMLCCGDGCTEAARLLGLMGLPNDTTMEGRSFGIIEERIGPEIRTLCRTILLENLVEEVRANKFFEDEADFERWEAATTDQSIVVHKSKYPKIRVSSTIWLGNKGILGIDTLHHRDMLC
jgi:hypothetical protein